MTVASTYLTLQPWAGVLKQKSTFKEPRDKFKSETATLWSTINIVVVLKSPKKPGFLPPRRKETQDQVHYFWLFIIMSQTSSKRFWIKNIQTRDLKTQPQISPFLLIFWQPLWHYLDSQWIWCDDLHYWPARPARGWRTWAPSLTSDIQPQLPWQTLQASHWLPCKVGWGWVMGKFIDEGSDLRTIGVSSWQRFLNRTLNSAFTGADTLKRRFSFSWVGRPKSTTTFIHLLDNDFWLCL